VDIGAVNRNLPPDVAPATPAKDTGQNRGRNNQAVSHLDRQASQIEIQVVDETRAVQSEVLPEDVLQLGEVVNQLEDSAIL
jgi:hypothetical protein